MYSKLALTLLAVPVQLHQCIKIHTQKYLSLRIIQILHVLAQLAAIIRCTSCRVACCPVVTLLHFVLWRCKILIKCFKYHSMIILLYAHVVGVVCILLVCWLFWTAINSTKEKPTDQQNIHQTHNMCTQQNNYIFLYCFSLWTQQCSIPLRPIYSLYRVNVNEILIVVVLRQKNNTEIYVNTTGCTPWRK
jgi:hypothetical protein